jgi:uncharacterized protein YwqG
MTYEDALEAIHESPLADMADRLETLLLPSIRVRSQRVDLSELRIGASRMGGVPDWPASTSWPHVNGTPLTFIAQIRMADLRKIPEAAELSLRGWLYFFYEAKQQAWGFDPKDRGHWRVLNVDCPLDDLDRVQSPPTDDHQPFQTCALSFELEYNLPDADIICGTLNVEFTEEQERAYDTLRDRVNGETGEEPIHRMFGFPDEIQNDMRLECQLASNGLYCGDDTGYNDPRAAELQEGRYDWVLLLQIDTDEKGPGWMWGDCGRLYFWIREQDLDVRAVENTWVILQCY